MRYVKPKADPAKTLAIILVGACLMVAIDFFVLDGKDYITRLWPTQEKKLSPQEVKELKETHSRYLERGLEERTKPRTQTAAAQSTIQGAKQSTTQTPPLALPYEEFYAVPVIAAARSLPEEKSKPVIENKTAQILSEAQEPYFKTSIKPFEELAPETMPPQPEPVQKTTEISNTNASLTQKPALKKVKYTPKENTAYQKPQTDYTMPKLQKKGVVVIIIDDMGLSPRSYNVAKLPGPLTLAYLPYADNLATQTKYAKSRGHELMVHMPMQPLNDAVDGGPTLLRTDQSEEKFRELLEYNLSRFDGFVGVNNHMGSKLTQNGVAMRIVMEELAKRNLFFVDSKTISTSVAAKVAKNIGLEYAERDIFLDHHITPQFIHSALEQVELIAKRKGYAIAIGHPHAETIKALKTWLPTLKEKGLTLKPVSAVLHKPLRNDQLLTNVASELNAIKPASGENVLKNQDDISVPLEKSKQKVQNQKIVVSKDGITVIPKTSEELAQPHE